MSNGIPEVYIPYQATAEVVVEGERESHAEFLRFLLPSETEITDEMITFFAIHLAGVFHDGIMMGLDLTDNEPISKFEAYQMGVQEGSA